jgi:hypothetical protein
VQVLAKQVKSIQAALRHQQPQASPEILDIRSIPHMSKEAAGVTDDSMQQVYM